MTKDPFESQLEALFAQPPRFYDTARFALAVESRLTRAARWRADLTVAAWVVAGGAALFGVVLGLDTPTIVTATAQATAAVSAAQDLGGGWMLAALAIGLALGVQALEDQLVRD
jgi:hypothetical protein